MPWSDQDGRDMQRQSVASLAADPVAAWWLASMSFNLSAMASALVSLPRRAGQGVTITSPAISHGSAARRSGGSGARWRGGW
jgi:hypothetical protein